ncbi:MAG: L,D-transpeptidase family protein [Moraxella sp.]|nr:L,D-transpeptidase family protein [Moraxella sp.]
MKKRLALPLFAIFILSAFAINFYQKSPNNPIATQDDTPTATPTLSQRQLELINQPPLPVGTQIDKLIVYKAKREMHAFYQGKLIKIYPISLGKNPIGHKAFEGDMKTPEGIYTINDRNPNSSYHKNLGISYPNDADIAHAKAHGKSAGGAIKIHGIKNGLGDVIGANHLLKDWTHGCIAVTNREIDELYVAVVDNAVIEILA